MGERQPSKPEDRHPATQEGLATTAPPSREGVVTEGEPQPDGTEEARPKSA